MLLMLAKWCILRFRCGCTGGEGEEGCIHIMGAGGGERPEKPLVLLSVKFEKLCGQAVKIWTVIS